MIPQHLLLILGASLAFRSVGFTRAGATAMFGLVAALGSILSARETDNLLFMAASGAIAVGTDGCICSVVCTACSQRFITTNVTRPLAALAESPSTAVCRQLKFFAPAATSRGSSRSPRSS